MRATKVLSSALLAMSLFVAGRSAQAQETAVSTSTGTAETPTEKRFFRAFGEMIVIGYSPWIWSHYVKDYDYANISMDTVRYNFEHGFWWDRDNFQTNMWGHPFQGSLYYNAGRVNGFNFWESSLFALAGDTGWEFLMESEQPSYNDMVNTWIGGTTRGEITYRLSSMVLDNRATGWNKFWRELGAGIINPVRFIDRAVFGDMWKKEDNPRDRLPGRLFMMVDAGYMRGRDDLPHPDQGFAKLALRQNDFHDMPVRKPFDYWDLEGVMETAKGPLIPWITYRGLLTQWTLKDLADNHHFVAPGLTFNYFNNGVSTFGGQGLDLNLFSRWALGKDFELRTEVGGQGYVAAGISTDYEVASTTATGRSYDFASGGGPRVDFRLRKADVDWLRVTVASGWYLTHNGISKENRIFVVDTEARYPLMKDLFAGVGWSLQDRRSLYNDLPATTRTNSEIKVFLSWALRVLG